MLFATLPPRILIAMLLLAVCAPAWRAAHSAEPAATPEVHETECRYEGMAKGFVSRTRHYTAASADVLVRLEDAGKTLTVHVQNAGQPVMTLSFRAFQAPPLQSGQLYTSKPDSSSSSSHLISRSVTGFRETGFEAGQFFIHELTVASDGSVATLALSYALRSRDDVAWSSGEVRMGAASPAGDPRVAPLRAFATRPAYSPGDTVWLGSVRLPGFAGEQTTGRWSVVSSPGAVEFSELENRSTRAQLSALGTYVLRYAIEGNGAEHTAEVTVELREGRTFLAVSGMGGHGTLPPAFLRSETADFSVEASSKGNILTIAVNAEWRVTIAGQHGERIEAGIYPVADPSAPQPNEPPFRLWTPGDSYWRDWSRCIQELTVHRIEWADDGTLRSLEATFAESSLAGVVPPVRLRGRIHYFAPAEPPNRAPSVTFAHRAELACPVRHLIVLDAIADDDLQPYGEPLTRRWEVLSGPGQVLWAADEPWTRASFLMPGIYRLRHTATDAGGLSGSAEMTVVAGSGLRGTFEGVVRWDEVAGGIARLQIGAGKRFTGSVRVGTAVLRFAGSLQSSYHRSWPLVGGGTLTLDLTVAEDGIGIDGKLSDQTATFTFHLRQSGRDFLPAAAVPPEKVGNYTFVLGSGAQPGTPFGHGFGRMTISRSGTVRLTGVAADGTPFSLGTQVQVGRSFPIWAGIYRPFGGFGGRVSLDEEWFITPMEWERPPWRGKRYPEGFAIPIVFLASPYTPPAKGAGVLSGAPVASTGELRLMAESWRAADERSFTLATDHRFAFGSSGTLLSAAVAPSTGLLRGTFLDPLTQQPRTFRGVLLQGPQAGAGFFTTPTHSGSVELEVPE